MPLTIHHVFPLGSDNIGDHLVAHALREAVVRHFGPARFVDVPANDRYTAGDRLLGLVGANVDAANREADLVLVGGSNMLEPRRVSASASAAGQYPWGVFTDAASLDRLRKPVLLAGMGTGSGFGKSIRPYTPRARDEIRRLHAKALGHAVRDVTTVARLEAIGVHAVCTGCPVTFLTPEPVRPVAVGRETPLLVSFPPSRIVRRWGGPSFLRGAMEYVAWLAKRGVPVVVTLHEDRDLAIAPQWVPAGVDVFHTRRVDEIVARYRASCGVVGFRLHAALLGLGLGRPILPVGVDWRGQAFIDTFQLRDVAIRPRRLWQFHRLRRLTEAFLAGDAALAARLDASKAFFRAQYERFLKSTSAAFQAATAAGTVQRDKPSRAA